MSLQYTSYHAKVFFIRSNFSLFTMETPEASHGCLYAFRTRTHKHQRIHLFQNDRSVFYPNLSADTIHFAMKRKGSFLGGWF